MVTWTAPATNGSAITSYTITGNQGAQMASVCGNCTNVTFTALVSGTTYTFTVTAVNAAGAGPASAPSNAVTPVGVAGPVQDLQAAPYDQAATVTFTAPSSNGGSGIESYLVQLYKGDGTLVTRYSVCCDATTYEFDGLTDGQTYYFAALAQNRAGSGPVAISSSFIPSGGQGEAAGGACPTAYGTSAATDGCHQGAVVIPADPGVAGTPAISTINGMRAGNVIVPSDMDEWTQCGAQQTPVQDSCGYPDNGRLEQLISFANLRPLQINLSYDGNPADAGDFEAIGFGLGCIDDGLHDGGENCSGYNNDPINPNNDGLYKMVYGDGSYHGVYYSQWYSDWPLSAGQVLSLRIDKEGDCFERYMSTTGTNNLAREAAGERCVGAGFDTRGRGTMGAENTSGTNKDWNGDLVGLHMTEKYWGNDIQWYSGAPSQPYWWYADRYNDYPFSGGTGSNGCNILAQDFGSQATYVDIEGVC